MFNIIHNKNTLTLTHRHLTILLKDQCIEVILKDIHMLFYHVLIMT